MIRAAGKRGFPCFADKSTKDRFHRYYLCIQPSNLHGLDKKFCVNLHGLEFFMERLALDNLIKWDKTLGENR